VGLVVAGGEDEQHVLADVVPALVGDALGCDEDPVLVGSPVQLVGAEAVRVEVLAVREQEVERGERGAGRGRGDRSAQALDDLVRSGVDLAEQPMEQALGVGVACGSRAVGQAHQPLMPGDRAVVAERVLAQAEGVGVLVRQLAFGGLTNVGHVDAALSVDRAAFRRERVRRAAAARLLAVTVRVDGHAPAGIVRHAGPEQRALGLDQLMPNRGSFPRYAAEHAAHGLRSIPRFVAGLQRSGRDASTVFERGSGFLVKFWVEGAKFSGPRLMGL
jgi:hypothetical protein